MISHTWDTSNNKTRNSTLYAGDLQHTKRAYCRRKKYNRSTKQVQTTRLCSFFDTIYSITQTKKPFPMTLTEVRMLQPCKGILKLWTGKRSQAGLLKCWENLNSIRREVSLKKHLISLKDYLSKYQFDGLFWTIFLQFYRKEMPLSSLKRYTHAREVLNSPWQAFQRNQRLTTPSWRLPGIALNLKNECPQRTNKSTSYTITLLSPKIGQDKTGFQCRRKGINVVNKNLLRDRR